MAHRICASPHERLASASLLSPGLDEKIAAVVFLDAASPRAAHQNGQDFYETEPDAVLWHQKNLSCVWISYRGSRGKAAHVNVTSFGQVRTRDHAFPPRDRNSIRHIPFRFFRGNS